MVMQCLILKWVSKDEFRDFTFSSDLRFLKYDKKKATKKIVSDKGQNIDFSGALLS